MTADRNDKKENTWSLQENHKRKFFPLHAPQGAEQHYLQ